MEEEGKFERSSGCERWRRMKTLSKQFRGKEIVKEKEKERNDENDWEKSLERDKQL